MSTGAALAAATQVLRMVLQDNLPDLSAALGGQPVVSAVPPDRIDTGAGEAAQLNVFLYRVEPNPAASRAMLPSISDSGAARLHARPLALNAHYVVSAYAKDDLFADLLLGEAMTVLHGFNDGAARFIREFLTGARPSDVSAGMWALLAGSGLDRQPDTLTLVPEALTVDDISKLWSVLGEKYRPSAAYLATVLLLEPKTTVSAGLPVVAPPGVHVFARVAPQVHEVVPAVVRYAIGTPIVLHGEGLGDPGLTVWIGTAEATIAEVADEGRRLTVTLPVLDVAGPQPVVVRRTAPAFGRTTTLETSPPATLAVRPGVGVIAVLPAGAGLPRRLRLAVDPGVGPGQDIQLLLVDAGGGPVGRVAGPLTAPSVVTGSVEFDVSGVPAGTYLVRIAVDGVESALTTAGDGTFDGPSVSLP